MIKKVLIAICPAKLISILKLFAFRLDALIVHIFCCSGMLASFYYVFMNRRFDREHKAVLKGRVQYKRSLTTLGKTSPLLRRNIHRLEKGLVMQPQRDTFAESYILETVENYAKCARIKDFSMGEYKWATDVLVEYFSKVAESDVINQARTVFSGALLSIENTNKSIPYLHETLPGTDVSYAQLKTLFTRRRSVRWYQNRTVEKNKILQAIDAAGLAPSACNRQPFRFEIAYGNCKIRDGNSWFFR